MSDMTGDWSSFLSPQSPIPSPSPPIYKVLRIFLMVLSRDFSKDWINDEDKSSRHLFIKVESSIGLFFGGENSSKTSISSAPASFASESGDTQPLQVSISER